MLSVLFSPRAVIGTLLLTPALVSAQTTWTGALSNDWNTAGNWSNGLPSDANQPVTIAADGAVVNMSAPGASRELSVSGNGTTAPVLNITQNLTNNFSRIYVGGNSSGSGFGGTINHTSGTVAIGGGSGTRRLLIAAQAAGSSTNNSGAYNFGGASGTAPVLSIADQIQIGNRPGETGLLSLANPGTLSTVGNVFLGLQNGAGTLAVSGGNLGITIGGSLSMVAGGSGSAAFNATFTSSGFSTVNIGGGVVFDTGAGGNNTSFNLTVAEGFSASVSQTFVVLDAGSAFTGHGVFGNVANNSTISSGGYDFLATYDGTGHRFLLTVTATPVPEPSTAAALAGLFAAGWAVTARRRRRIV